LKPQAAAEPKRPDRVCVVMFRIVNMGSTKNDEVCSMRFHELQRLIPHCERNDVYGFEGEKYSLAALFGNFGNLVSLIAKRLFRMVNTILVEFAEIH
jgi:hypothetical protein